MAREKGGPHYVWGICTNLDKDGNGNPCPNCKSKEKLKLSIRDEFVCPECGEPLTKVKGPSGPDIKKIGIIAAVVLVLAGSVFGIYKLANGSDSENVEVKKPYKDKEKPQKLPGGDKLVKDLAVANAVLSIKEGETAALGLKVSPANYEEEITKESSTPDIASVDGDSIKAHKAGKAVITIKTAMSGKTATIDVTVIAKSKPGDNGEESKSGDGEDDGEDGGNGWGKVNLGYGIYEGYRKNNKPHGHGTIRYTTPHQIVSWKDFKASPGDTFEGEFRDGKITGMGYWKHDGNVTAIQ